MINDILWAAFDYFHLGWSVIPIQPRDKKPQAGILPPGKDGRGGWEHYQATRPSYDELSVWFSTRPSLNLAVVTGRVSRLVVVDLDGEEGVKSFKELVGAKQLHTCWVTTGNGFHGYFHYPLRLEIGNRVKLLPGLDIRGNGGYVVAPPSVHSSGKQYEWNRVPHVSMLADLPHPLLDLLIKKPAEIVPNQASRAAATGDHAEQALEIFNYMCDMLSRSPSGNRNNQLNLSTFTLARICATGALKEADVKASMATIAIGLGLNEHEVERTIASAFRAGMGRAWIWHRS